MKRLQKQLVFLVLEWTFDAMNSEEDNLFYRLSIILGI